MADPPKIVPIHPMLRDTLVDLYGEENIQALEGSRDDVEEFLIEPDEAEAERFRLELERDARSNPDDW